MNYNDIENKILEIGYDKQTPKEFNERKKYQAYWHIIRPSVFWLFIAIAGLIISFNVEKSTNWSNLCISIFGGIIAGVFINVIGNIREKRIKELKIQAPEINKIKTIYMKMLSLIVKILKMPEEILFFCYEHYYLTDNIPVDELIKEFKSCLNKLEQVDIEELTILKEFEKDLYNDFINFKNQGFYRYFKDTEGKEFVDKLKQKKDLFINIISNFHNKLVGIDFYAKKIEYSIL